MKIIFYVNQSSLLTIGQKFDWPSLCFSLLEGDFKNDKVPRHVEAIFVSNDEAKLLDKLKTHAANKNADVFYLVAFSHKAAATVESIKSASSPTIFIVNPPGKKHPAALVALADGVKRIRGHHVFHSTAHTRQTDALVDVRFTTDPVKLLN